MESEKKNDFGRKSGRSQLYDLLRISENPLFPKENEYKFKKLYYVLDFSPILWYKWPYSALVVIKSY